MWLISLYFFGWERGREGGGHAVRTILKQEEIGHQCWVGNDNVRGPDEDGEGEEDG